MPDTNPEIERLWGQLWTLFFNVDDRYWAKQPSRLKEIARVSMALAAACEELSRSPKGDESG